MKYSIIGAALMAILLYTGPVGANDNFLCRIETWVAVPVGRHNYDIKGYTTCREGMITMEFYEEHIPPENQPDSVTYIYHYRFVGKTDITINDFEFSTRTRLGINNLASILMEYTIRDKQ